ncbi:MAG: hypothetical protein RLZZ306_525 [Bacteroidota bacterium]|jgi:hypothetical protein
MLILIGEINFEVIFRGYLLNYKVVRMDGINTNLRKKWYFHKIV